jgi:hypothetical protein
LRQRLIRDVWILGHAILDITEYVGLWALGSGSVSPKAKSHRG